MNSYHGKYLDFTKDALDGGLIKVLSEDGLIKLLFADRLIKLVHCDAETFTSLNRFNGGAPGNGVWVTISEVTGSFVS